MDPVDWADSAGRVGWADSVGSVVLVVGSAVRGPLVPPGDPASVAVGDAGVGSADRESVATAELASVRSVSSPQPATTSVAVRAAVRQASLARAGRAVVRARERACVMPKGRTPDPDRLQCDTSRLRHGCPTSPT